MTVDFTGFQGQLHCTAEEATKWQTKALEDKGNHGIMSYLLAPLRRMTTAAPSTKKKSIEVAPPPPPELHAQFFPDNTIVEVAAMGWGRIVLFRPEDNVYKVELRFGNGYFNPDSLSHFKHHFHY